ncbi:MAG: hypothetical protein K1X67_17360 [Fimbriimonadaceae bacterium]|nr:hypothetical protein [Fimbriimonadaceae bacterium]
MRTLLIISLAATLCGSAFAITQGQLDDFQNGTDMNWTGGLAPANVGNGQGGASDLYLRASSNGAGGPGGHMAFYNQFQWTGNYTGAGVRMIECDMINLGATELKMRVVLFSVNFTRYLSSTPVTLPAGSGWRRCQFPIRQSDVTLVLGSETYAQVMAGVSQLMFRHNPTISANGVAIVATLGIDNIVASAGWKMSGNLTLSDYGGTYPSTATFEFRQPGTANVVYTSTGSLSGTGAYSVYSPPVPGAYDVSVKVGHWLRKTIALANTNADLSQDFALINGDVDDDNEIGIGDYAVLSSAYNSGVGDPNWVEAADLNGDEAVDIADYAILSANYGLAGDE